MFIEVLVGILRKIGGDFCWKKLGFYVGLVEFGFISVFIWKFS